MKAKGLLSVLFAVWVSIHGFSQFENTIWYFGTTNSGLGFTNPGYTPVALNDKQPLGLEGSGVAVHPVSGNLMFYSDGQSIYDANHSLMVNGSGMGGCSSSAHAVAICPIPGQCNRYYLFSNGTGCSATEGNVRVNIVDMNLGATGQVLALSAWENPITNNLLGVNASESMILIPIADGSGFWLVGKERSTSRFYSYRIDANFNPETTPASYSIPGGNLNNFTFKMKYSSTRPLNSNVAITGTGINQVCTLGFDPGTGVFSNYNQLVSGITGSEYGVEFSPNGNLLYFTTYINPFSLHQYDFSTQTLTQLHLNNSVGGGALKLGPDGRIYVMVNRNSKTMGVINNPNISGTGCNFNVTGLDFSSQLNTPWNGFGFPDVISPEGFAAITISDDITVCSGTPVNLSATGGNTYSWSPSTGLNDASSSTPVATPSATTTYTVTIRNVWGCEETRDVTITVEPSPVVLGSLSPSSVCIGDPVTITLHPSSNASSYTYSTAGSANHVFSGSVVVNPEVTGNVIYTVKGQLGNCITSLNLPVTVSPCLCAGGTALGTNGTLGVSGNTTTIGAGIYLINNDIVLNGDVTFNNCELRIAPSVEIRVPNGKQFEIVNSSHLYACNSMWDGIRVDAGGKVRIAGQSNTGKPALIEDAKTAINFNGGTSLNQALFVKNTVFNRNNIGITISNYNPNSNSYNISVENTTFTCRSMPASVYSNWTTLSSFTLATFRAAAFSGGATLLDDQHISQTAYPFANLKIPMLGMKSAIGINLSNVGLSQLETTPNPVYKMATLGSSNASLFNLYDNQNAGIQATRANVMVQNSKFQNSVIDGNPSVLAAGKGRGVYAVTSKGSKNKLVVNQSEFTNCHYAVDVNSYFDTEIARSVFKSTQTLANYSLNSINVHQGLNGIWIKTNQYRSVTVDNNSMYNIDKGILFSSVFGAYQAGQVFDPNYKYSGQVDITNNILRSNYGGYSTANTYLKEAIIVDNVVPLAPGSHSSMLANSTVNTSENEIYDAYRGILVRNWNAKKILIEKNIPITLKEELPAGSAQLQFGISNENNVGLSTTLNPFSDNAVNSVYDNTVTGFSNNGNTRQVGILSSASANQRVKCNRTFNSYHGIKFNSNNPNTFFITNSMTTHFYAFVLDQGGIIGPQYSIYYYLNDPGTPRYQPFDNKWLGNSMFKTATLNSSTASNSIFYVRNTTQYPEYNPVGSTFTNLNAIIDDYTYVSSNTGNLRYAYTEPPIPPLLSCIPGTFHFGGNIVFEEQERIGELERIARNELPYNEYAEEHKAINGHRLFRVLEENPELMTNSLDLQTFYENSQQGNPERVKKTELFLVNTAFAAAENELTMLQTTNDADQLYRDYYTLYSRLEQDSVLTAEDSLLLYGYAALCPYVYGAAVFQARALYGSLFNYPVNFEDVCDEQEPQFSMQRTIVETTSATTPPARTNQYRLFPNPSQGSFYLQGVEEGNHIVQIRVMDAQGKIVFEREMTGSAEKQLLHTGISQGMYILVITNTSTHEREIHKIWINP